jgi:hypothetical protein
VSGLLGPGSSAYPKTRLKSQSRRHLHFLGLVFSALQQRAAVQTNRAGNSCYKSNPAFAGFFVFTRHIPHDSCNGFCQFAWSLVQTVNNHIADIKINQLM